MSLEPPHGVMQDPNLSPNTKRWISELYKQIEDLIVTAGTKYEYEVARGNVTNTTTWNKWGYNSDIDIGTETVWSVGGTFTPMSTAGTLNVVSSSTADDGDPAGTGANSIILYGVDANYDAQTEVVTLDGTTTVTTSNSWLGVNRASVYLAGSGQVNAGTISITATTGGAAQTEIPTGEGSSQHAFFFVPASRTALMDWLYINIIKTSAGAKPEAITKCWVTSLVSGSQYDVMTDYMDVAIENAHQYTPAQPFIVGEKSLVEFRVTTDTDNTAATVRFSLITVPS